MRSVLSVEVKAERLVEFGDKGRREDTQPLTDSLDRDRSDVFCLGLGVAWQSGQIGQEQNLEG